MLGSDPMVSTPNWQAIEQEYRAAQMSLSGICAHFKISRAQLNDQVAKYGWSRNLSANVKASTDEAILRRTAGPDTAGEHTDFIEKAADRTADVVMEHRKDIVELRNLATRMRERLSTLVGPDFLEIGDDGSYQIHPLDKWLLGKNDGTLSGLIKLTDAFAKIITMERQAYGLDDPNAPLDADAIKNTIEAARQELLRRGTTIPLERRTIEGYSTDGGSDTGGVGPKALN